MNFPSDLALDPTAPEYLKARAILEQLARAGVPERAPAPASVPPSAPAPHPEVARPAVELSERTFRDLVEALPDAVVVIDAGGVIVLVNQQTERLFGYAREELLGRPIEVLVPERFRGDHVGHRTRYFAELRTRPMGQGLVLLGRRKNGAEFPVEISLSPLLTEHGPLATSVIRDVNQREREEAEFRTLIENIPAVTFRAELDVVVDQQDLGQGWLRDSARHSSLSLASGALQEETPRSPR